MMASSGFLARRILRIVACVGIAGGSTAYASECVSAADVFEEPVANIAQVDLTAVLIGQAYDRTDDPVPLAVEDHSGDGLLDVWVRWSERAGTRPAVIRMKPEACEGVAPRRVDVSVYPRSACILAAFDETDALVAMAAAKLEPALQNLTLRSSTGIRKVEITGSEIAIVKVCWRCDLEGGDDNRADRYAALKPRTVIPLPRFETIPEGYAPHVLVVKFQEGTRMRLRDRAIVTDASPRDRDGMRRLEMLNLTIPEVETGAAEFTA
jgi:hypothetical protein